METSRISFEAFLPGAFDQGDYSTDDAIAFVLPLFRKVLGFHEAGLVAPFDKVNAAFVNGAAEGSGTEAGDGGMAGDGGICLDMDETLAHSPTAALYRIEALFPRTTSRSFEVVGKIRLRTDVGEGFTKSENVQVHPDDGTPPSHPAYIRGYRCYELYFDHHDPLTDIFCLGLMLGSMALGLDLYDPEDLKEFARVRTNPSHYQSRVHPTLGRLITEMTELDRSRRSQDLYDVIRRLEHYRDYDPEKQVDLSQIAGWVHKELRERDAFILNRLRNRLFDTTRRNRLLYFKPNMRFVNLTVSSVPIVLHYQSIRPELLFTWNGELAEKITGMQEIVLNKYLRFEDHGYLPSSLDRVRVEAQRDIQEYGFSQLKLVIAFLNWHNLKETANERIQTPLLLLPVSLKKNKKVKEDHYVLKVLDNVAEVNPILASQLSVLYGIRLPDFIDLDEMSPEQFYQIVRAQVEEANQGIVLHYIDKPRIRLIHSEARQTVSNYRKRLRRQAERGGIYSIPYSYDPENYHPLGLALFRHRIEPKPSQLEFLVDPEVRSRPQYLAETDTRQRELYSLAESESNPYSWDFDVCHMVLGNFHYKKMSLVRDYNLVIDQQLQHHVFDAFFDEQPRVFPEHVFNLNRPDDWYHVIAADPAQTRAILQSRAGYSFIIQGPPGTGKSQTITNLIADFVARGKNILFVCEKRAALDVVYHRLKQVGLEELCCYIHDSQGDKREFIRNLKGTYEEFARNKMDLVLLRSRRQALVDGMNGQLDLLRGFHEVSLAASNDAGVGTRQLIERLIVLRPELAPLTPGEEEMLPSYREWQDAGPVLAELEGMLDETGSDPVFATHPFSRLREALFSSATPHRDLAEALQQALAALTEVEQLLQSCGLEPAMAEDPDRLRQLVQFAVLLYPLARVGHLAVADPDRAEARELGRQIKEYKRLQETLQQAAERNVHWRDRIEAQDLEAALALAIRHEGRFLSGLNSAWRKLMQQVRQRYDLSRHTVRPTIVSVLENLKAEYVAAAAVAQARQRLQDAYQLDNIDTAWRSIDLLQHKKGHPELDYLLAHARATELVIGLNLLHSPLSRLETFLQRCWQESPEGSISGIRDALMTLQLNADGLGEWLPTLRAFSGLSAAVKKTLRNLPLRRFQAEGAVIRKTLQEIYQENRQFSGMDQAALEKAVQQLGEGYKSLQVVNADTIRAFVRQRFAQQLDLSGKPASQLNEDQKKFKRTYMEGRKILENEFGKSMRYKSIRELSAKESGVVLRDLKPVWLMSPYSVSDSLPLDVDHFDVVIFDEASQITLEEGVPSLYRSRQTIVVGDEKQMPPTDFFSAVAKDNDPDDLDKPDDESEDDEWLSDDADSLLAQGTRKLESSLLSWHYRSHYETLISYSNHAFYEGELLTIPDKSVHHREKEPLRIAAPEEATGSADCLFDRSISYHLLTRSVYDKRSNVMEARYIARLIKELLGRGTKESIGVVAFSQEQQHAIEEALEGLAAEDIGFAQQLEEAYNRTENDQFTGLIVKNLENIQGDERDIIIMSVCYGPDADGRMIMNFGPVNKRGGEKRLNVLFSRARMHMAVVTSIRYENITNQYNEGANYLRRFLQYAEAVSEGKMGAARAILDGLAPRVGERMRAGAPTIVRQQLREQLAARGYEVAEQVGQSGFKCSLAVKRRPEDAHYSLAILIDDELHYRNSNLIEQYYQRPAILRSFGWKVLPVYAKDWLHQPQKVMEQVWRALGSEGDRGSGVAAGAGIGGNEAVGGIGAAEGSAFAGAFAFAGDSAAKSAGEAGGSGVGTTEPRTYDHLAFRRLVLADEGGEKFWEVATDGRQLVIRRGRSGSKGQISLTTFPDEGSAREEGNRQREEQIKKGYEPR
jgi:predicted DNA-binding WGR domain protein